jgi:hypothetical protein
LGDGLKWNWTLQQRWFPDFEPILDFVHPTTYVYEVSRVVAADTASAWLLCQRWLKACWQGRVSSVLEELRDWQASHPMPPGEELPDHDVRVIVSKSVTYLSNNESRMNYPKYRRLGLPVTSSLVESLIKEFNYRVKGSEKAWNRSSGGEWILQVRNAVLCDDGWIRTIAPIFGGLRMSIGEFRELRYSGGVVFTLPAVSKFKDERMFQSTWTDEDQRIVERLAKKFGVDLNDPKVAGENATFASIEAAAGQLGKAITRQITQDLALQQTKLLDQPQACPTCGTLCQVEVRQRDLTTGDALIELPETVCQCSACRRDFFPSTRSPGTASTRL